MRVWRRAVSALFGYHPLAPQHMTLSQLTDFWPNVSFTYMPGGPLRADLGPLLEVTTRDEVTMHRRLLSLREKLSQ